jgi:hypothetical protein
MSKTTSPLISIVIPTRDRPEYAALAVEGLRRQSFQDFEVILSDNALRRPFAPDPRLFDGVRFRYVRPPKPLWMTDHWEFAVAHARGRYVGILGDKSLLVPSALALLANLLHERSADAASWYIGGFEAKGPDLSGPGTAFTKPIEQANPITVPSAEVLDYLLATYLDPNFEGDTLLEIRGSIYHGVFSRTLLDAMKARYGRIFRFYAPDVNGQCAAMQVAREVTHIRRPLEWRISGPSNGVAVANVTALLKTQEEAARGGASPPLIPNISASVAHLLASDLAAVSGRSLREDQWIELHRRTAFDLYRAEGWPDRPFRQAQLRALETSAVRIAPEFARTLSRERWKAYRAKTRTLLSGQLRKRLGPRVDGLRRIVAGPNTQVVRRQFGSLFEALDAFQ